MAAKSVKGESPVGRSAFKSESLPWVKIFTSLPIHRKSVELSMELDDPRAWTYVAAILLWIGRTNPSGVFCGKHAISVIERAAEWTGERGQLVSALLTTGFLDAIPDGFRMHNWEEKNGAHASKCLKDKQKRNKKTPIQVILAPEKPSGVFVGALRETPELPPNYPPKTPGQEGEEEVEERRLSKEEEEIKSVCIQQRDASEKAPPPPDKKTGGPTEAEALAWSVLESRRVGGWSRISRSGVRPEPSIKALAKLRQALEAHGGDVVSLAESYDSWSETCYKFACKLVPPGAPEVFLDSSQYTLVLSAPEPS